MNTLPKLRARKGRGKGPLQNAALTLCSIPTNFEALPDLFARSTPVVLAPSSSLSKHSLKYLFPLYPALRRAYSCHVAEPLLPGNVPELEPHDGVGVPLQHLERKVDTDLIRPRASVSRLCACARVRSPFQTRAQGSFSAGRACTYGGLVVLRKDVVHVALDDARLSGANVAHDEDLVQVLLDIAAFRLRCPSTHVVRVRTPRTGSRHARTRTRARTRTKARARARAKARGQRVRGGERGKGARGARPRSSFSADRGESVESPTAARKDARFWSERNAGNAAAVRGPRAECVRGAPRRSAGGKSAPATRGAYHFR